MAFLWRRKSLWFKFIILAVIFWITIVLIHFSDKKGLELTKPDFNEQFKEFLIDSRKDVNQFQVSNSEYEDYDSKTIKQHDFSQKIIYHNETDGPEHKYKLEQLIAKPGEMGRPVVLPSNLSSEVKKLIDEGWAKNAFNEYVSNMISMHRQLPDPRFVFKNL